MELEVNLQKYKKGLNSFALTKFVGKLNQVTGALLEGFLPGASLGSICEIIPKGKKKSFLAEVVGFRGQTVLLLALEEIPSVGLGARIQLLRRSSTVSVGESMLGRVLNSLGEPIDGGKRLDNLEEYPIYKAPNNPMDREVITEPLDLGIKAINGFTTIGKGQRVGIMAGSGVGKSVLMGMMAKCSNADVNVIALIGERGREIREFIEDTLGEEGLKKSIIVAATSDQSPLVRMRGAYVATTIAEYFAQKGSDVMMIMDSVTRFAMAQREIGLSVGEPPTTKGYTPTVFSTLPKLLERAGNFENSGSITGLYTVLVEGDDMDDPIADSVRSIVDGHIVLSRDLAQKSHFPAIDILQSTSRVMRKVVDEEHVQVSQNLKELLAVYRDIEDLVQIGAYAQGSDPKADFAIQIKDRFNSYLKQELDERVSISDGMNMMRAILDQGPESE